MLGQNIRVAVRVLVSVVLGAATGALYGGLVVAVHLGVYGRWDRVLAFALGCVLVGAVLGLLLRCIAWALSGESARDSADSLPPPSGSRHAGSAR